MATKSILTDKIEIVLMVPDDKGVKPLNLTYDQISRIQFDPCTEFRFFKRVPSEKITITTGKYSKPIVYTKLKHKKYFEEYKKSLEEFAADNRVTLVNNL